MPTILNSLSANKRKLITAAIFAIFIAALPIGICYSRPPDIKGTPELIWYDTVYPKTRFKPNALYNILPAYFKPFFLPKTYIEIWACDFEGSTKWRIGSFRPYYSSPLSLSDNSFYVITPQDDLLLAGDKVHAFVSIGKGKNDRMTALTYDTRTARKMPNKVKYPSGAERIVYAMNGRHTPILLTPTSELAEVWRLNTKGGKWVPFKVSDIRSRLSNSWVIIDTFAWDSFLSIYWRKDTYTRRPGESRLLNEVIVYDLNAANVIAQLFLPGFVGARYDTPLPSLKPLPKPVGHIGVDYFHFEIIKPPIGDNKLIAAVVWQTFHADTLMGLTSGNALVEIDLKSGIANKLQMSNDDYVLHYGVYDYSNKVLYCSYRNWKKREYGIISYKGNGEYNVLAQFDSHTHVLHADKGVLWLGVGTQFRHDSYTRILRYDTANRRIMKICDGKRIKTVGR